MIALIQRVKHARVTVDGQESGAIGEGLLILLGVHSSDTHDLIPWLASKCTNLRIFPDDDGKMNRSIIEHGGDILVVSQFTLYANAAKGNRPSFIDSARPEVAEPLYEAFCEACAVHLQKPVYTGTFGAMMDVALTNWGPVTINLEKRNP